MTAMWLLAVGLPIAVALLLPLGGRARSAGMLLAPATAVPALALALWTHAEDEVFVPWLLLGARLGVDTAGQIFLFFTALLWTLAAQYARAYLARDRARHRFYFFFLLTMSGNLGLIVARDVVSFYLFFALMTLSAYGLVVHDGSAAAYRAGRVYIVMAVIGEACLLAGFLYATQAGGTLYLPEVPAAVAASPARDWTIALLLAGFGIKAGALPLHMWLPLAHPVAPTPASAVLSGCMIKAGLLGWLRFLPLGEAALPAWGVVLIAGGLGAAFFGVVVGVTQVDPKTNLAYSSISQMGIMNTAAGVGIAVPEAWPAVQPALLVYALHHALAKGALFLGTGTALSSPTGRWKRGLLVGGLLLCALAIAGAPLTSGAVAKTMFKEGAELAPLPWVVWLDRFLPLTSVGTGLLMGRFLLLTLGHLPGGHRLGPAAWAAWAVLLGGVAALAWVLPGHFELDVPRRRLFAPGYLWTSFWPVLAAVLALLGLRHARRRLRIRTDLVIAAGDVLVPLERAAETAHRYWRTRAASRAARAAAYLSEWSSRTIRQWPGRESLPELERRLARWETAGMLVLLLMMAMLAVFYLTWSVAGG